MKPVRPSQLSLCQRLCTRHLVTENSLLFFQNMLIILNLIAMYCEH